MKIQVQVVWEVILALAGGLQLQEMHGSQWKQFCPLGWSLEMEQGGIFVVTVPGDAAGS